MSLESGVGWGLLALGAYVGAGLVFVLPFHALGLRRVDPAVTGAGFFFRLLITPGLIALWPLFALRWRRVLAGGSASGPVQSRPLSARGLRSTHSVLVHLLAVLLPVALGLALALRPGAVTIPEPVPLPRSDELPVGQVADARSVPGLEIEARLRTGPGGARQLELVVAEDLEIPDLMLYAVPAGADRPGREAVFLGSVWGPGVRRYALGPGAVPPDGAFLLYSVSLHRSVASFDWEGED